MRAFEASQARQARELAPAAAARAGLEPVRTHVVLLDGTMSSLSPGCETNIGLTYRLLRDLEASVPLTLYYEPGIQWRGLRRAHEVMAGIGINRQIRRAYLFLARNYRAGDAIVLMGYSRGAYAVRSLAGLIDQLGLLRAEEITEDRLARIYELYRRDPFEAAAAELRDRHCHPSAPIRFLGVYDTVRALGLRWPVIWRFSGTPHPFHSHALGPSTQTARHALALHESRAAYEPVLWRTDGQKRDVQQMWFAGNHGDIGGQLGGRRASRPLANVSLRWMLGEAEAAGLPLPRGWRARFPADAAAPSIGPLAGWGKAFWSRRRRRPGDDPSERVHKAVETAASSGLCARIAQALLRSLASILRPAARQNSAPLRRRL